MTKRYTEPLSATHPELAREWDYEKNGALTPDAVTAGMPKKVSWKCEQGHVWETTINARAGRGAGCKECYRFKRFSGPLSVTHTELVKEWDYEKNGDLTPDQLTAGSAKNVFWCCEEGHSWRTSLKSRMQGAGCPECARLGRRKYTEPLSVTHPELAGEWDYGANNGLTPDTVTAGFREHVFWKCEKGHTWKAFLPSRLYAGVGCPYCSGLRRYTDSFAVTHPEIAKEWDYEKNGDLTSDQVTAGSGANVYWRCQKGHSWQATVASRVVGSGLCPFCTRWRVAPETSLLATHPSVAKNWHPTKNGELTPADVLSGYNKKVWWMCPLDPEHGWEESPKYLVDRFRRYGDEVGCPRCARREFAKYQSLGDDFPEVAALWHPTKNGDVTPFDVKPYSRERHYWQCSRVPFHIWRAAPTSLVSKGSGCPTCAVGWNLETIRPFVASLLDHWETLSSLELYCLFQELVPGESRHRALFRALAAKKFPYAEVVKFAQGEASQLDRYGDVDTEESDEDTLETEPTLNGEAFGFSGAGGTVGDILAPVSHLGPLSKNEDVTQFLVDIAVMRLWKRVFNAEAETIDDLSRVQSDPYMDRVIEKFSEEYRQVVQFEAPEGYIFPKEPFLMQKLEALRLVQRKSAGNWSGTGSGKTLSALLASRMIGAKLTVICCPFNVVDVWKDQIGEMFAGCQVEERTWAPLWKQDDRRYLILNYEMFQGQISDLAVRRFVERFQIDMLVVDEIHYVKQRDPKEMSRRRDRVGLLRQLAGEKNPELRVLGMSATPVVNNLMEGKGLLELVEGREFPELMTRSTVDNCIALFKQMRRVGVRWMPNYDVALVPDERNVECDTLTKMRLSVQGAKSILALEKALTEVRLPIIRQVLQEQDRSKPVKVVIYTLNIGDGIVERLQSALEEDGWKVGCFTGEDKRGLVDFLKFDTQVLIGSSAMAVGLDGIQNVCNTLIFNVLPWTAAEFEQVRGRVYREGQKRDVRVVLPLTYAMVNGERWSWDDAKMARIAFKKDIASAAVDGDIPDGQLQSPETMHKKMIEWLRSLEQAEKEEQTVEA